MSTRFTLPPGLKKCAAKDPSRYALNGADVRPDPDHADTALISLTDGRILAVLETEAEGLGGPVFVPGESLQTGKAEAAAERDGDGDRFIVTIRGKAPTVAVCPATERFPPVADVIPDPANYRPVCRVNVGYLMKLAQALASDEYGTADCLTILCATEPEQSVRKPLIVLGKRGSIGVIMPVQIDASADECRASVQAMRERVRRTHLSRDELGAENAEREARAVAENPLGPEAARALMADQIGEAVADAGRLENLADGTAEALAEAGEVDAIRAEAPEGEALAEAA